MGRLPADARAFRGSVARLVPRLVDTKDLAARLGGQKQDQNLAQLYQSRVLSRRGDDDDDDNQTNPSRPRVPRVAVLPEPGFDARCGGAAHNAGFDSWMTAAVFVQLADEAVRQRRREEEEQGEEEDYGAKTGAEKGKGGGGVGRREELFWELNPFLPRRSTGQMPPASGSSGGFIPGWDQEMWKRYGNKVRLGRHGVMDLAQD